MDITDYMIDSVECEEEYAKIIALLTKHGAKENIKAFDGGQLIDSFTEEYYPLIHRAIELAKKYKTRGCCRLGLLAVKPRRYV